MSETTETFIQTFEKLKAEINKRASDPGAFEFKLDRAARADRFVDNNRDKLRYIREVRDLLQHPRNESPQRPFAISESFLEEVQALMKRLSNPPTAKDIWVPRSALTMAGPTDRRTGVGHEGEGVQPLAHPG